jgi:hypothetical protein
LCAKIDDDHIWLAALSLISCPPADRRARVDYACECVFRKCALRVCVCINFLPLRVICLSVFLLFCVAKLQFIVFSLLSRLRVTCIIHEMEKYSLFFPCAARALMLPSCTGSIQISSRLIQSSLLKKGLESRSNLSTALRRVIEMLVARNFCSKAEHQFLFALLILQFAKSILVVFFFPRLRGSSSERNQCSAIKSYSILDYKAAPVNYGHFILHARALSLSLSLLGVFTKANETLFRSVPQLSAFFCAFFLAPQKLNSPSLSSLFTRLHTKRQCRPPPFLVMLEWRLCLCRSFVRRVCYTLFKPRD